MKSHNPNIKNPTCGGFTAGESEIIMKIKKLYWAPTLPDSYVIEALNGKFYRFDAAPFRFITEKDLKPLPGFLAKGSAKEPKPEEMHYRFYGLEKA